MAPNWLQAACRRARNWKFWKPSARKVPPEVFTTPYTNPVGGSPEAVRENLREALRLLKEAGYRGARSQAGRQQDGERSSRSNCSARIRASSGSCCSSSLRWSGSALPSACAPSIRRSMKTGFAAGISTWSSSSWGAVAVAGQRAARILGLAGGGHGGFAQYHRHQESGDRQADRAAHLRQGPRRPGRGDQGARPRAAVESLRRAAVELPQGPHRALGSLRPAVRIAEIRPVGFPGAVVVSTPTRRRGSANGLEGYLAHGAILPPACARSRCRRAGGCAPSLRRSPTMAASRDARPFGVRRTEISRRLPAISTTSIRTRRRADCFRNSSARGGSTFNSLNAFIVKGDRANGMELTFASLMARAFDEPDAVYLPGGG